MDLDAARQRLFVAELGNDTVAVVDLQAGKMTGRIIGVVEPQGIVFSPGSSAFVPAWQRIGQGARRRLAPQGPHHRSRPMPTPSATCQRPAGYVGFGDVAHAAIAAANGEHLGNFALAGHTKSFQLETAGPRIFVNLPTVRQIAVVDRVRRSTLATWQVTEARANFPMALDERDHRLVVATWQPPTLIVFNTESGDELGRIGICADADDVFYDTARPQLYVSCGEGLLDVLTLRDAALERIARIATAAGARTALFVPEFGSPLYCGAAPRHAAGRDPRLSAVVRGDPDRAPSRR